MMKTVRYLFSFVLLFSMITFAQITNTVTFKVDITDLQTQGFSAGTHTLKLEGLNWDNGSVSVSGDRNLSPDPNNPSIYMTVLSVTSASGMVVGDSIRYKYKGGPDASFVNGGWESGDPVTGYDGRAYVFRPQGSDVVLTPVAPRLQLLQVGTGLQNTVTFIADLSAIYGTGPGSFDPNQDILEVKGFWGDGSNPNVKDAYLVSGNPVMEEQIFPAKTFKATLTIELPAGSTPGNATGFKFKASPDARFSNTGWETTPNRIYTFRENNANVTLTSVVPAITPLSGPLTQELKVLFQVHLVEGSQNRYDHSLIPRDQVTFAVLKGAAAPFGSWRGNWSLADTLSTDSACVVLNDKAQKGDKVAGDNIYSAIVTFPAGTAQGASPYKYGVWYPGCDAIPGASGAPLDNSAPSGQDLSFTIKQSNQMLEVINIWPTVSSVSVQLDNTRPGAFELRQNYPNPFNPETSIKYAIQNTGLTRLVVYNALGQEVAALVNEVQSPGTYEVRFKAANLPSGAYFYTLHSDGFSATKKMLYLK